MPDIDIDAIEVSLKELTIDKINKHPTKSKDEIALEFFIFGTIKESKGLLNEAINYYRKAFKLDEKIDLKYREMLKQGPQQTDTAQDGIIKELIAIGNKMSLREHDSEHFKKLVIDRKVMNRINVRKLLKSYDHSQIGKLDESQPTSIFERLPNEIILKIMELLIIKDTPSWVNLSLTCNKLAYLGFYETSSWKVLCDLVYPKQVYNEREMKLNEMIDEEGKRQDVMISLVYDDDWNKMLQNRPFIKFNGIYISTVVYQREGGRSEFSNAWNLPFRIITYYRYFRFYPDGSCLKMSTVLEPEKIVPKFCRNWRELFDLTNEWEKNVHEGKWEVSLDGQLRVESSGAIENYKFIDEFQISHGGKYARHHKLDWIRMGYINEEVGIGNLRIDNERSFKFSRVRSYYESSF